MDATTQNRGTAGSWVDRAAPLLAGIVWVLPLVVISVGIFRRPGQRSLDPIYRWAVDTWLAHGSLYTDEQGFIYLPTFIPIYLPFAELPVPWGEILWRTLAAAGIAHALWSLMALVDRPRSARGFLVLSVACLPVSLGALQMGQANAWIAMSLFQAAAAMGRHRLWLAGAWLGLGFAIKPIVVAAMGIALLRRWQLALPMAVMTAGWLAAPLLTAPAPYVVEQYADAVRTITGSCATVTEHRFADINGILRSIGIPIPSRWSNAASALAGIALATLTALRSHRHCMERWGVLWLGVSCCYLLLFNPMTEANSYCLLGVPASLLSWHWLGRGEDPAEPRRALFLAVGWGSLVVLAAMGVASEIARPWIGNSLDLWFFPCCALAFGAIFASRMAAHES